MGEVKAENLRVKALKEFIKEKEINGFEILEPKEEGKATVFKGFLGIKGQRLPLAIIVDNTIYSLLQIEVARGVVSEENKEKMLELVNKYNAKYRMLTYTLINGTMLLSCSIPATNDHFEPALFMVMIEQLEKHLNEVYSDIMIAAWGK